MLLSNTDWPEVEFFKSDPPGRNESDRKSAKMQNNGKTKTFAPKAPKSFLQRFMKQDLSVMKAGVVSFQMAPAVSKYMAYRGQNEYYCEHSQLWRICMKVESGHKNILSGHCRPYILKQLVPFESWQPQLPLLISFIGRDPWLPHTFVFRALFPPPPQTISPPLEFFQRGGRGVKF